MLIKSINQDAEAVQAAVAKMGEIVDWAVSELPHGPNQAEPAAAGKGRKRKVRGI